MKDRSEDRAESVTEVLTRLPTRICGRAAEGDRSAVLGPAGPSDQPRPAEDLVEARLAEKAACAARSLLASSTAC